MSRCRSIKAPNSPKVSALLVQSVQVSDVKNEE
jgi:hypothetical protein